MTITTDQIYGIGVVGIVLIVLGASIAMKLAKSFIGRTAFLVMGLILVAACWASKDSIQDSLESCDPQVLFVHIQISDPQQLADCRDIVSGQTGG